MKRHLGMLSFWSSIAALCVLVYSPPDGISLPFCIVGQLSAAAAIFWLGWRGQQTHPDGDSCTVGIVFTLILTAIVCNWVEIKIDPQILEPQRAVLQKLNNTLRFGVLDLVSLGIALVLLTSELGPRPLQPPKRH